MRNNNRGKKIIFGMLCSLTILLVSTTLFNNVNAESIYFITPNSNTVWQPGQTVTINWGNKTGDCCIDPANPDGCVCDLSLLKGTGQKEFITQIAKDFELVNCSYIWHIPANVTNGDDFLIHMIKYTVGKIPVAHNSETFTIGADPLIPSYSILLILSSVAVACFIILYSIHKKNGILKR